MEKIAVTKLELSKHFVNTNEKVKIKVFASSIVKEPISQRLAFILGSERPKV